MVHSKIKYLIGLALMLIVFGFNCISHQQGFTTKVTHNAIFYRGPHGKDKIFWSKIYSFPSFEIIYQPEFERMIIKRAKIPDTLTRMKVTPAEEEQFVKNYGDFKLLGAFENYNLPPEFSHLLYVNTSNLDVLQVDRMITDAKGTIKYTRAFLFMKDSVNYMSNSRLFALPGE